MTAREMFTAARSACKRLAEVSEMLDALEDGEWDGSEPWRLGGGGSRPTHRDPTAAAAAQRSEASARLETEFDRLAERIEEAGKAVAYVGSTLGSGYADALDLYYLCGEMFTWWDVGGELGCSASTAKRRCDRACALIDSVGWPRAVADATEKS